MDIPAAAPVEPKPADVSPDVSPGGGQDVRYVVVDPKTKPFLPTTLSEWADLVAKLGAVFLVAFGVYEYLDGKTGVQTTRTQDFMKDYSTGSVADARHTIAQTLRSSLPVIEKLRAVPMGPEAAAQAQADMVRFFVWDSRDSKGLADELDTVIDFYDRLVICVEHSLCERDVARAYFQEDARWLFKNFHSYIVERRANLPDFAVVAERLTSL